MDSILGEATKLCRNTQLVSTDASTYAHFLFNAFDMDRNGSIRFEDFVIGLSVLLRGSVTEKLNWAFNLYDINKDGYITKEVCDLTNSTTAEQKQQLTIEMSSLIKRMKVQVDQTLRRTEPAAS